MTTTHPVPTPAQPYLRRGEAIAWIEANGLDKKEFEKLVTAGVIERITLRTGGRGYYLREAVELHLIKPFREAEARLRGARPTT